MTALTITCIIGTNNIGVEYDESVEASINAYRAELETALTEKFPEAAHIDVVIENGDSKARVEGLGLDDAIEHEEGIIATVDYVANEVWNRGNWHNS